VTDDELERAAELWIADYFQARHLLRTRDWVVQLDPGAGEAARIAALTHDIERRVPGGPRLDPRVQAWDDAAYLRAHSERSARLVGEWLAGAPIRAEVERLIARHEVGGDPAADLLQAADSLSFLEVNRERPRSWVEEGRCDVAGAQAKLDLMRDRIMVDAARPHAIRLHAAASGILVSEDGPVERDKRRRSGVHRHP
jgi:hypothetical protein